MTGTQLGAVKASHGNPEPPLTANQPVQHPNPPNQMGRRPQSRQSRQLGGVSRTIHILHLSASYLTPETPPDCLDWFDWRGEGIGIYGFTYPTPALSSQGGETGAVTAPARAGGFGGGCHV